MKPFCCVKNRMCRNKWAHFLFIQMSWLFFSRHEVFIVFVPDRLFPFRNVELKNSSAFLSSCLAKEASWLTFSALADWQRESMSKKCLYGQLASKFSYTWAYLLGTGQPPFFDKHFCARTTKDFPANCVKIVNDSFAFLLFFHLAKFGCDNYW